MSNLSEDGYIIMRNKVDTKMSDKCLDTNKINYSCIYDNINKDYFPIIQKQIPESDSASFRRFIFSNNNYSSMDSLYHANSYNHIETNKIPVYCAYIYFSTGMLEIVPGSHIKNNKNNYGSRVRLNLQEGDIVILNTNLHNRSINNGSSKVLKILDIFPNEEIRNKFSHNLITVQMNNSLIIRYISFSLIFLSKINFLMNPINYSYYFLLYHNIQYKFLLENINSSGKMISYEANVQKDLEELSNSESWNTYIICDKNINKQYIGNNLSIILVICLLLYGVLFSFLCNNKSFMQYYKDIFETYTPKCIKDFMTNYNIHPIKNGNKLFDR